MNPLRRQLPVRSPLTLAAALAPLGREDARPAVQRMLEAEYPGRSALLTSSGTHALQLALALVKEQRGDAPVAMPAYACFDLATAALGAGVRVRLYDVEPRSLQPDLDSLARAVGDDAAAVVIVHLYGVPVPVAPIRAIATKSGAVVIEDCAQGIGAEMGGEPVGMQGEMAVLSFGRGKGVTGGGGGALLVSDGFRAAGASRLREATASASGLLPFVVKGLAQWALARPALYGIPSRMPFLRLGETIYHEPTPVAAMSAAVARTLLRTWPLRTVELRRRRANAQELRSRLQDIVPGGGLPLAQGADAGWLRLPVLLPAGVHPDQAVAAPAGIVPAYPISLEHLPPFAAALLPGDRPAIGAQTLAARLWTLPTHAALTPDDLDTLTQWMRAALADRPAVRMPHSRPQTDARS